MPLSARDRRTLMIGGAVAGVLIVGVLLMNLLGGGGGSAESALPSFSVHPSSPTPTPTATPTGAGGSPVAVFTGRDPFSIPPGFSPSASATSPTSTSTSTSASASASTSVSTSTSTTPPPSQPGNGSSGTHGGHTVVLLDVYQHDGVTHAQIEIDGVVYKPAVGASFGPSNRFKLVSASGNCASLLYGDESFTLCITPQK